MPETPDFQPGEVWQNGRGKEWFVVWEPGQSEPHMIDTLHFLAPSTFIADLTGPLTRVHVPARTDGGPAVVQAKNLSCQGLQMVDPDQPIRGGQPVEGFRQEMKRRGEGHVFGCELIGHLATDGGTS